MADKAIHRQLLYENSLEITITAQKHPLKISSRCNKQEYEGRGGNKRKKRRKPKTINSSESSKGVAPLSQSNQF